MVGDQVERSLVGPIVGVNVAFVGLKVGEEVVGLAVGVGGIVVG